MTHQPGNVDPEPPQAGDEDYTTLQSVHNVQHQVVVPMPKSYETAMKIALHQLGRYIYLKPGSELHDAYFQYKSSRPAYDTAVWADLPRQYWTHIVRDEDMLLLCTEPSSEMLARKRMVKYVELLERPSEGVRVQMRRAITFPWPRSYCEARLVAQTLFHESRQMSEINLFMRKEPSGPWLAVGSNISEYHWDAMNKGDGEKVEMGVWGY
ncbi:hypothetical protein CPB84DRAFT_1784931 [Gymnopilus junonius]|uniref:Uncharacterized protein n=1 Tax=Gymnopilus junonius TaxID=109634 RepID=A0A9P5NJD7_GYMJU|nr:hypothetical protein CPB84DRAFT_1784931 [Gymnopilus junonius]